MASYTNEHPLEDIELFDGLIIPIDSDEVVSWCCLKCRSLWKESPKQLYQYRNCPYCSRTSGRLYNKDEKFCDICCSVKEWFIKCDSCSFECCRDCLLAYAFSISSKIRCVNNECGKILSPSNVRRNCDKMWFITSGYLTHINRLFIDSQISKFPQDMVHIPKIKELNKIESKVQNGESSIEYLRMLNEICYEIISSSGTSKDSSKKELPLYIQGCPVKGCIGLINENYVCAVCNVKICCDCRVILVDDHTCDPDVVKTVGLIKSDTKPCPKCVTLIYKIEGCDQMFCTNCNTAFSWQYGTIETGTIHNPHYFEWVFNNPDAAKNSYNLLIINRIYNTIINSPYTFSNDFKTYGLMSILMYVSDERMNHPENNTNAYDYLLLKRLEYLSNSITREKFESDVTLNRQHTTSECARLRLVKMIHDILCEPVLDLYYTLTDKDGDKKIIEEFMDQLSKVRLYINETIINEYYDSVDIRLSLLDMDWNIVHLYV